MLSLVEVRSAQGTLLSLPLEDTSGGFAVEDIDGLDPVKATITSSKFAQMDKAIYQSSTREQRNIVIKVGLEPDFGVATVKQLRDILYGFFMPKSPVDLRFYDDEGLVVDISGRVETCGAPLFTKDPEVDISILCFDSDFVELDESTFSGSTVSSGAESLLSYAGSVETPIDFTLNANRSMTSFTIYNRVPGNDLQMLEFAYPLSAGDVLKISTTPGAKGATLTRAGSPSSVLFGVDPQANWIKLMPGAGGPGPNYIRVYASGAAVPFTIDYYNRYGGL